MDVIEFQWLHEKSSKKEALQEVLGCSGQMLKKYFSSKELSMALSQREVSRLPLNLVNHMFINPHYSGPDTHIIKETPTYLAVHKPAGIHCHPLQYQDQDTLLNFLVREGKWPALMVNSSQYDRGLLYRLDYETSGVMILSKSDEFYHDMRKNFESQMKQKFYLAIVEGEFSCDGEWTHYFRGTGLKGAKQKVSSDYHPDAQSGNLKVKKLLSLNGKSVVLVKLTTGLRHQIRAQLSFLGFPIVGDELYGGQANARLFLHAWRYEWTDIIQDDRAELFDQFFDLNSVLQMGLNVLRGI